MKVYGGPLHTLEVEWTEPYVDVPVALTMPTPDEPDSYYVQWFEVDVYERVRPMVIQGEPFYRYVGRERR